MLGVLVAVLAAVVVASVAFLASKRKQIMQRRSTVRRRRFGEGDDSLRMEEMPSSRAESVKGYLYKEKFP